jgi:hypothetical protein
MIIPMLAKKAVDEVRESDDKKKAKAGGMAPAVYAKGGCAKKMAKGGSVSSASKRADGCAQRGKTRA